MPSKRPNSVTLTFSKKNQDIKALIFKKEDIDPTFIKTDYFCEAARFYEKYKNAIGPMDNSSINDLIDAKLDERINELKALLMSGEEAAAEAVNEVVNPSARLEDDSIEILNEDED